MVCPGPSGVILGCRERDLNSQHLEMSVLSGVGDPEGAVSLGDTYIQ